jgi:hypothetical protein
MPAAVVVCKSLGQIDKADLMCQTFFFAPIDEADKAEVDIKF